MWLKNLKLIGQEDIIVSVTIRVGRWGVTQWKGCFRKLFRLGLEKDELIYAHETRVNP